MSEEKLYAVKNDEGKWLCIEANGCHYWSRDDGDFFDQHDADILAHVYGGHVVELIEKPNPEVVSKEEAEILKKIKDKEYPASEIHWIANKTCDQERLMRALVNGYTVAKEKKYNVKVPHTKDVWYYKSGDSDLLAICPADKKLRGKFTESEIKHYGLQDCEKEELTDDDE